MSRLNAAFLFMVSGFCFSWYRRFPDCFRDRFKVLNSGERISASLNIRPNHHGSV